jgi:hypothetical protein
LKTRLIYLTLLFTISITLYVWGLDYGHPDPQYSPSTVQDAWLNGDTVFHPDAFAYVGIGYRMMVKHDLFPSYYHNPSLNIYSDIALFVASNALALPHNASYGDREIAPFSLYVMGEVLSALFALLTVALAYAAGKAAFDWRAGLITAVLVAVSPLSVQHAHYATPNAETITAATAALLMGFVILKRPTRNTYLLGGLMVGFTISARYNAGVIGIVTGLAMLTAWFQHRRWDWLVLGIVAIPVAFLIGTPGAIGQVKLFLNDFIGILTWYKVQGGGPGWTAPTSAYGEFIHWRYTLLIAVGPVAALAAVLGLLRLIRERNGWYVGVLVTFFVVYSVSALPGKRVNANLLLPLIAPLSLLAAYGLLAVWERLNRRYAVILMILLIGWPLLLAVWFDTLIATPDTRIQAQAWIYQHIPRGTTISLVGSYNVPLDPKDYTAQPQFGIAAADGTLVPTNAPIVVYSDSIAWTTLRDPQLSEDPQDINRVQAQTALLQKNWKELARFARRDWPGQNIPPDDVSYWHQMEIVIYCNPANCPIK